MPHACQGVIHTILNTLPRSLILINFHFGISKLSAKRAKQCFRGKADFRPMSVPVESSATLPEVTVQGAGSIPILSFTADDIRWVQPR
jgi:hypothetical protein